VIAEDSERCPHCERYISDEDAPAQPRSKFVIVMMIVTLLIVVYWLVNGM
jgi:hypothetical protein